MNNEPSELETVESDSDSTLKKNISGVGQMIIGGLETVGGILTGDPLTRAEGEFNIAVGEERADVETELQEGTKEHLDK